MKSLEGEPQKTSKLNPTARIYLTEARIFSFAFSIPSALGLTTRLDIQGVHLFLTRNRIICSINNLAYRLTNPTYITRRIANGSNDESVTGRLREEQTALQQIDARIEAYRSQYPEGSNRPQMIQIGVNHLETQRVNKEKVQREKYGVAFVRPKFYYEEATYWRNLLRTNS